MKGDIDRREAEVNITIYTPINLETPIIYIYSVLLFFCDNPLVDIGMKRKKRQWLLKDSLKERNSACNDNFYL